MDTVKQFYDKTIYDACKGSTLIHGSLCHIGYNTIVPSMNLELLNPAEEAMFPTLVITNKKVFDISLMVSLVLLSIKGRLS